MNLRPFRRRPVRSVQLRGDLVRTCDFCGKWRLDEHIAVVETTRVIGRVPVRHTRRYCRDREECREKATRWMTDADQYGNVTLPA